jgi:ergothioneine biosynthesis protein EgtC
MCRLLAYLGSPIALDSLILRPEHSLLVQSYRPKELEVALLNADGFGFGWYDTVGQKLQPYSYRNVLPMWNDGNLPSLCGYIRTGCFVANVRSATPGLPLDFSNCQPFQHGNLLFVHNGYIERFRQTLYRPMRDLIGDVAYQNIYGLTDSEHIFNLLVHLLEEQPSLSLADGLAQTVDILQTLAHQAGGVRVSASIVVSTGTELVAARFDNQAKAPSFYWLSPSQSHSAQSYLDSGPSHLGSGQSHLEGIVLASEPLFAGAWTPLPQSTLLHVKADLSLETYALSPA